MIHLYPTPDSEAMESPSRMRISDKKIRGIEQEKPYLPETDSGGAQWKT